MRAYDAFIVTDVPGMTIRERDLARRFITFIDAVYEGNAKLVLTTEKPLTELFVSRDEIAEALLDGDADREKNKKDSAEQAKQAMDSILEDVDESAEKLKSSNLFAGEEEAFAFARALSRLKHMEPGMGGKGHGTGEEGWQAGPGWLGQGAESPDGRLNVMRG